MSITYCLTLGVVNKQNTTSFSIDVIKSFLDFGWSLYSENKEIIYTDLGNDNFDYRTQNISINEYFEIVKSKEQTGEIVSFALFLYEEKAEYRIDISITLDFKILISPDDATRKELDDAGVLDVSWYLDKTVPALKRADITIESISFVQI